MSTEGMSIPAVTLTTGEAISLAEKNIAVKAVMQTGDVYTGKDISLELSDKEINALLQQLSGLSGG